MAVPSTYDLYMQAGVASRVVHATDESF